MIADSRLMDGSQPKVTGSAPPSRSVQRIFQANAIDPDSVLQSARRLASGVWPDCAEINVRKVSETVTFSEPLSLEKVESAAVFFGGPGQIVIEHSDRAQGKIQIETTGNRVAVTLNRCDRPESERLLDGFRDDLGLTDIKNLALCLSGGGFRATLFHLGIIRFLSDTDQLRNVTHICSVSGGSVLAAHLVRNWAAYVNVDSFDEIADKLIRFVRSDVRGRIFRRWIMGMSLWPFLKLSGARSKYTRTALLEKEYQDLFDSSSLNSLGAKSSRLDRPQLHILATAMKTGELVSFTASGFEIDWKNLDPNWLVPRSKSIGGSHLPIAKAVAASSASPAVFPPVRVTAKTIGCDQHLFPHDPEYLTDGGVYDNLGIRKMESILQDMDYQGMKWLISDASSPFDWRSGAKYSIFVSRAARATNILMKRVSALDYERVARGRFKPKVVHCSLSDVVRGSQALNRDLVGITRRIRTDLDTFSEREISCLVAHGYLVARKRCNRAGLFSRQHWDAIREPTRTPWNPLPRTSGSDPIGDRRSNTEETSQPVVDSIDNHTAILRRQHSRLWWLPSVFHPKDWASWVMLAAVFLYCLACALSIWAAVGWA